jgi:hypothetical protein
VKKNNGLMKHKLVVYKKRKEMVNDKRPMREKEKKEK